MKKIFMCDRYGRFGIYDVNKRTGVLDVLCIQVIYTPNLGSRMRGSKGEHYRASPPSRLELPSLLDHCLPRLRHFPQPQGLRPFINQLAKQDLHCTELSIILISMIVLSKGGRIRLDYCSI